MTIEPLDIGLLENSNFIIDLILNEDLKIALKDAFEKITPGFFEDFPPLYFLIIKIYNYFCKAKC